MLNISITNSGGFSFDDSDDDETLRIFIDFFSSSSSGVLEIFVFFCFGKRWI